MSAAHSRTPAAGGSRLVEDALAEGVRLHLLDALLDGVADAAEFDWREGEREDPAGSDPAGLRMLVAATHDDELSERAARLEERILAWVLAHAKRSGALTDPGCEWAVLGEARAESPTISRSESRALRIGSARIGGSALEVVLAVAHGLERLRSSGEWRALPVGCVVRSETPEPARARIGRSVIEGRGDAAVTSSGTAEAESRVEQEVS